MAKTKIDDLPKGAEEMDAEEQKAAKGGARAAGDSDVQALLAQTGAAAFGRLPTLAHAQKPNLTTPGQTPGPGAVSESPIPRPAPGKIRR